MFFINLFLFSQIMRAGSLIEIPTSFIPQENLFWQINASSTFAGSEREEDFRVNLYLNKRFMIGLNVFTLSDIAIDFGYLAIPEKLNLPAISFGFRNITYKKYIGSAGGGNEPNCGFEDECYMGRNPELLSFYTVVSKHFTPNIALHFGLGRGEFIGYGPRSKYLNTDYFSDSRHEYLTFGIFGGAEVSFSVFKFAVEIDGRDLNAGVELNFDKFRIMLAGLKLEHAFFESNLKPRFGVGFEVNSGVIEGLTAQPVEVALRVYNKEENTPVQGAVIRFLNTSIQPFVTDYQGVASGFLMPGSYMIQIEHKDYKPIKAKLKVKRDKPLRAKVLLTPRISKRDIAMEKIREGDALLNIGKLLEAKRAYEDAIKIYPLSKTAKERLAKVEKAIENKILELKTKARDSERKGDYKTAITYWKEVLVISPNDVDAPVKIAELQKKLTAPKPKPKPRKIVKKKKPAKPSKAQIASTLNRAIQAFNAGNYKKAKKLLQQVLKWDPNNSRAMDYLRRTEARLRVLGE